MCSDARDGGHRLVQPLRIQPWGLLAIDFAQIDFSQFLAQHVGLNHLGKVAAARYRRVVNAARDVRPAQALQLRDERFFNVF